MPETKSFIMQAGVDIGRFTLLQHAMTFMYVAKDMNFRPDALNGIGQRFAADMLTVHLIQNTIRRRMRYQYVGISRNAIPYLG